MPEDRRFELSEADDNIVKCLIEECVEVAKECCKVGRFTFDNTHEKFAENENTPRKRLSIEMGQLQCLIFIFIEKGMVDKRLFDQGIIQKYNQLSEVPYNIVKIVEQYDPDFDSTKPTPDVMLRHKL